MKETDITSEELINKLMKFKKIELVKAIEEIFYSTWYSLELDNQFILNKVREIVEDNKKV